MEAKENEEQIVFKVDPEPFLFWTSVSIPLAGDQVGQIRVQYLYMPPDEYRAFFDQGKEMTYLDALSALIKDWSGPDAPYSRETLERLVKNYPRAPKAFIAAYRDEIFGVAEKN